MTVSNLMRIGLIAVLSTSSGCSRNPDVPSSVSRECRVKAKILSDNIKLSRQVTGPDLIAAIEYTSRDLDRTKGPMRQIKFVPESGETEAYSGRFFDNFRYEDQRPRRYFVQENYICRYVSIIDELVAVDFFTEDDTGDLTLITIYAETGQISRGNKMKGAY